MRHLILFGAMLCLAFPAQAAKKDKTTATTAAVNALVQYCLPPVKDREDPAAYVLAKGFAELPPEQASKFSPEGGRVFEIPDAMGNAVLIVHTMHGHSCAVAVHEMRAASFWDALDKNLKDFSLMREKRVEEDRLTKKEYRLDTLGGPVTLLVTGSDVPRPNGLQALMTLARVQK